MSKIRDFVLQKQGISDTKTPGQSNKPFHEIAYAVTVWTVTAEENRTVPRYRISRAIK
jgi:hypothetical protein